MALVTVPTKDGGTVEIDQAVELYDPVRDCVRPKAKGQAELIAELTARMEAAEARIALLESGKV